MTEEVTQSDRDAAAAMLNSELAEGTISMLLEGRLDSHKWVQAFKNHRIANQPPAQSAITPEWCLNMAKREGDSDIGAGLLAMDTAPQPPAQDGLEQLLRESLVKLKDVQGCVAPRQYACNLIKRIDAALSFALGDKP